jgi:hypothetical protein
METKKKQAILSTVAVFPEGYFLENFAVRSDNVSENSRAMVCATS